MGQEHGMSSGSYCLFGIALGKSQFLQFIKHQSAYCKVYVCIFYARLGHLECIVMTGFHDRVNLQLALCELTAYRHGACIVRTIVVDGFCTCIAKSQAAFLEYVHGWIAMHDFTVLGKDGWETDHGTIRVGNAVDLSCYIFLCQPRTGKSHGCGVHLVTDDSSTLQFLNLFCRLGRSHLHYSLNESKRCFLFLLVGMNAEQIEYLQLDVPSVRREEVYLALLRHGVVADGLQRLHWSRVLDSHLFSHIVHTVYASVPNDVFNVYVVANECLDVIVYIYHTNQSVSVLSEVIQERRVLSKRCIPVIREIARRFVVAKNNDDAASDQFFQLFAALDISILAKHILEFYFNLLQS